MEWSSGHRQQRRRGARLADDVSQRAHLDEAQAVAAPQRVVVLALQAVLADQPGAERARGKAPLAALRLRHLAQVPDQMRDERSEEHTSELQSRLHLVCRLLLEK